MGAMEEIHVRKKYLLRHATVSVNSGASNLVVVLVYVAAQ
jgi:hypothetical protein